jgi:hypothetical protein
MSKKKISNLVTNVEEPEEFSAILEENAKLLLSKFSFFVPTLVSSRLVSPRLPPAPCPLFGHAD